VSAADVDVAIVGAGAVGSALALALAQQGRRVALVDGRPGPSEGPGEDYGEFVVSLNLASVAMLSRLGVWPAIAERRVSPYGAMALWDAGGRGETRFDSAAIGEPVLGYFVEAALAEAVLHRAVGDAGVAVHWGRRIESLTRSDDRVELAATDGGGVSARLAVGADGARSPLRGLAGIDIERYDYGQRAIVCNFATERDHGAVARQRFLPGGPVAMLPLADGRCSLAWFRCQREAERLAGLGEAAFCSELTEATERALGAVTTATRRRTFPIVRRHACDYVDERLALVGDAAHTIHPQAGQGMNIGLLDAAALAGALAGGGDPGRRRALRAYARWRRGHNTAVMAAMDLFHHGFAYGGWPRARLRNIGMEMADRAGPVKTAFIRRGAGIAGDLPPLAQPLGRVTV
jgi:2-octaprenylphenol hydroxylase